MVENLVRVEEQYYHFEAEIKKKEIKNETLAKEITTLKEDILVQRNLKKVYMDKYRKLKNSTTS